MKTKCTTVLIALLLSVPCHAKKEKTHFASVEEIRRNNHRWASGEIQDLNNVRVKILKLSEAMKLANESWKEISTQCKGSATGDVLVSCHGKMGILANSANINLSQLEILSVSDAYQNLITRPSPKAVNFQQLVADAMNGFRDFAKNAAELRRRMGLKMAAEEFQKALARMKETDQKVRADIQCRLMPPVLSNKLITATLLQREARQMEDPHRLLQSQLMAKEVSETVESLISKCPNEIGATIQPLQAKALDISARVLMTEVQSLAAAACKKIGNADVEIESACRDTEYSPALLYSIHRKLEQLRTAK